MDIKWNMGDLLDAVARAVPAQRPAIIQGERVVSWGELDGRSNRLARNMMAGGLLAGDRVALVSRNAPEYLESMVACFKARLVQVNINYRYRAEEVAYVFRDCSVAAVVYQKEFEPVLAEVRADFPGVKMWICCDGEPDLPGAVHYDTVAASGDATPLDIRRSGDDALLLYTGGTTGMPKGVQWTSHGYRESQLESPLVKVKPRNIAEHVAMVAANDAPGRVLPACPLMHGAGMASSVAELLAGGTVLLLPSMTFDPDELWAVASAEKATRILIVGDVFARPMLAALDARPGHYDLSCLKVISSAGLIWSEASKKGLLRHAPWLLLVDIFGASEASGLGYAITSQSQTMPTGEFIPGPKTVLITEDNVVLGSGQPGTGMLARSEPLPEGYFGDPQKTAQTFQTIGGVRYGIPGDLARRDEDGRMFLIGRGSLVINTGGEKVFVEEVEEALKALPGVNDALVVGLPDERWGSIVVALLHSLGEVPDEARLRAGVAGKIAGYKVPKLFFTVDVMPRSDSGKADYKRARALAAERQAL